MYLVRKSIAYIQNPIYLISQCSIKREMSKLKVEIFASDFLRTNTVFYY